MYRSRIFESHRAALDRVAAAGAAMGDSSDDGGPLSYRLGSDDDEVGGEDPYSSYGMTMGDLDPPADGRVAHDEHRGRLPIVPERDVEDGPEDAVPGSGIARGSASGIDATSITDRGGGGESFVGGHGPAAPPRSSTVRLRAGMAAEQPPARAHAVASRGYDRAIPVAGGEEDLGDPHGQWPLSHRARRSGHRRRQRRRSRRESSSSESSATQSDSSSASGSSGSSSGSDTSGSGSSGSTSGSSSSSSSSAPSERRSQGRTPRRRHRSRGACIHAIAPTTPVCNFSPFSVQVGDVQTTHQLFVLDPLLLLTSLLRRHCLQRATLQSRVVAVAQRPQPAPPSVQWCTVCLHRRHQVHHLHHQSKVTSGALNVQPYRQELRRRMSASLNWRLDLQQIEQRTGQT